MSKVKGTKKQKKDNGHSEQVEGNIIFADGTVFEPPKVDQSFFKVYFLPQICLLLAFNFFTNYPDTMVMPEIQYDIPIGETKESYNPYTDPIKYQQAGELTDQQNDKVATYLAQVYPLFMDVHVMVFLGFGFLYTFPKTHNWTSLAFVYCTACWVIQLSLLLEPFLKMWLFPADPTASWSKIDLSLASMIQAEYCAVAVMVSIGQLIGKLSYSQLFMLSTFQVFFYSLNKLICTEVFPLKDVGGTILVHVFGAFFGLAASTNFIPTHLDWYTYDRARPSYISNLVSAVGMLFLFMYWPSFNAIGNVGTVAGVRIVVNTTIALTASTLTSGFVRLMKEKEQQRDQNQLQMEDPEDDVATNNCKFDMKTILRANLSGGVMIGCLSEFITQPVFAFTIGVIAGLFSSPLISRIDRLFCKLQPLKDTSGMLYVSGIPGIVGALLSWVCIFNIESLFTNQFAIQKMFPRLNDGSATELTVYQYANYQLLALIITLAISLCSGKLFGMIVAVGTKKNAFDDSEHFVKVDYRMPKPKFEKPLSVKSKTESKPASPVPTDHGEPLLDFRLSGGDFTDPKTMDANSSLHINGISYLYYNKQLFMDFILSTGERSTSPKPPYKQKFTEMIFRGATNMVACSYSCYSGIGVIEIYEDLVLEGNKCVGLRFLGRKGQTLIAIGNTKEVELPKDEQVHGDDSDFNEPPSSLQQPTIDQSLMQGRDKSDLQLFNNTEDDRTVRVITVSEFERVIGVRSQTNSIGQHFNMVFELATDNGDFGTTLVGNTPESRLYNKHDKEVVFGRRGDKNITDIIRTANETRGHGISAQNLAPLEVTHDD